MVQQQARRGRRRRHRTWVAVGAAPLALALAATVPAGAVPGPAPVRASVSSAEAQANGPSTEVALSRGGRWVVFTSTASNLVAGDTNGVADVFLRDRTTGTTRLVSRGAAPANGPSGGPSISEDGRVVAFTSTASNLVAGDTNGTADAFVLLTATGSLRMVSRGQAAGSSSSGTVRDADLSADGQRVAFTTDAADLGPNDTHAGLDVYVRAVGGGPAVLASRDSAGVPAGGTAPSISRDGRFVAFSGFDLRAEGGDPITLDDDDLYVRDLVARRTTRVVVDSPAHDRFVDDGISDAVISPDGDWVAFATDASNLVLSDPGESDDVYLWHRTDGSYTRLTGGLGEQLQSRFPIVLGLSDGAATVLWQWAPATRPAESVTVATRRGSGLSVQVARNPVDVLARFDAGYGAVDTSGTVAAFSGVAAPVVAGDTNGVRDVFAQTLPDCTIRGTAGPDVLRGTAGPDAVCGLGGNDVLEGLGGDDLLAGGAGRDTVTYEHATRGVTVDLDALAGTGAGRDQLGTVELVTGSPFADSLSGDGQVNVLTGLGGDDVLDGRAEGDRLVGGSGADTFADSGGLGTDTCDGGPGTDADVFGDCEVLVSVP